MLLHALLYGYISNGINYIGHIGLSYIGTYILLSILWKSVEKYFISNRLCMQMQISLKLIFYSCRCYYY